jgi:hypothetical protein
VSIHTTPLLLWRLLLLLLLLLHDSERALCPWKALNGSHSCCCLWGCHQQAAQAAFGVKVGAAAGVCVNTCVALGPVAGVAGVGGMPWVGGL